MKIITLDCSNCGTVVAANELEERRVMKCPGLDCQEVFRFKDLGDSDREHFLNQRDQYQI